MESKRKIRKVQRVVKAIPAPKKSQDSLKPESAEALIVLNGLMVQQLFESQVWREIILPLIQESIASVSGRYTNGRFHYGSLTRDWKESNLFFLSGYQRALEEFTNRLDDFVVSKNQALARKKEAAEAKDAPLYNPFLEEQELED